MKMTMAQALVRFLEQQYIVIDGRESRFVAGVFAIFGHGNVVGLGEALVDPQCSLILRQGKNEQGMGHAAMGFAKQHKRQKIYAVSSSIGPGAMNMVTAAATATVNRIPVLFLPGDIFASRQPDPVLQQLEQFHDATISVNDAFKPVSVYFARIERPEQIMSAAIQAMRTLTNPQSVGAVTLALPQDVQAEAYDYPDSFFKKRIHVVERPALSKSALERACAQIQKSKKPLIVCGGGVRYSDAGDALSAFSKTFNIPFAETQAGKGVIAWDHPMNLGGIGVTGSKAANSAAKRADLLIAIGSRLSDFTTASKSNLKQSCAVMSINSTPFDAYKLNATPFIADAKQALQQLYPLLKRAQYRTAYQSEISAYKSAWDKEVNRIGRQPKNEGLSQSAVLYTLNNELLKKDDIVVSASGSLPGDMQRIWRPSAPDSYHMEYGFSCMGYEVSAALGIKLAHPHRNVYSFVGDGGYAMLHSELITALQEQIAINILLFDNNGFQVIDNLQVGSGIPSYANEWRARTKRGRLDGPYLQIDWAQNAAAYGAKTYTVRSLDELRAAFADAQGERRSTLFDIKVTQKSMTSGYESFWRVGIPEISRYTAVKKRHAEQNERLKTIRKY